MLDLQQFRRFIRRRKRNIASNSLELLILALVIEDDTPLEDLIEIVQGQAILNVNLRRDLEYLEAEIELLALFTEHNRLIESIASKYATGEY